MRALYHRDVRYLLSFLFIMIVAGCSSTPTQYYVLNTVASVQQNSSSDASDTATKHQLAIRQLEIPRYLDRPRIVSRDAENHLRIAEYHQWGGRLRDDVARTLSDDLAEYLDSMSVITAPFPGSMHADISLLIDIRQFERLADGRVHLKVRWHIQQTGKQSQSYFHHIISETNVSEHDYAAMAGAMSQLLATLSEKMAIEIKRLAELDR
ncbi:membrane integrity-associated transporter subunit PqiC [Mariprofundus sp. EBB-1]|uniref:PqiC family protein n=1 Tax=Mariprofundus sp. EBB-1 TaxID=2650971 RepID=UPI000EF19CFB|nr:PqiC family protein [Mariprofundus sp. EBB-1]RLL56000.1 membrane integrity-associated transporter subunit PqiC [Mariprofundus sp. EBB-1]